MSEITPTRNLPVMNSPLMSSSQAVTAQPVSDQQRFADAMAASQVAPDPELALDGGPNNQEIEDRFLALLIAQMRNQDPMNPLENSELTTQLAQINSASGIESINQKIGELLGQTDTNNPVASADVLGRDVLVKSDLLDITDPGSADAIGGASIPGLSPDVSVEIFGEDGAVIRRLSLGYQTAGVSTFAWDGLTDGGQTVDPGQYQFRVIAPGESGAVELTALSASRVLGVTRGEGSVGLQLEGGKQVSSDDVYGIY